MSAAWKAVLVLVAVAALGAVAGAIWVGTQTFEGTVVSDPYGTAVKFDESRHHAERLGWRLALDDRALRVGPRPMALALAAKDGKPLEGAQVGVRISRPGTARLDRPAPVRPSGAGRFLADVDFPEPGLWDVIVDAALGDERLSFERRVQVEGNGPAAAPAVGPAGAGSEAVPCALGAPCAAGADGLTLALELGPRPLRPLTEPAMTVEVRRGGLPVEGAEVSVEISMPGMYMGENRTALAAAGAGRYAGKVVLVRCASGRRDWVAEVTARLPGGGAARARFRFEVAE